MATQTSYKAKAERLAVALAARTKEAEGWKAVAEHRILLLDEVSSVLVRLETAMATAPFWRFASGPPPTSLMIRMHDPDSTEQGAQVLEDVADQLLGSLKTINEDFGAVDGLLSEAITTAERTDLRLDEALLMSAVSAGVSGLSLAEMGAHARDVPPLDAPLSPPLTAGIGGDEATPVPAKKASRKTTKK